MTREEIIDIEWEAEKAYRAGQGLSSNPYWPTDWQYRYWKSAWLRARIAYRNQRGATCVNM